MKVANIIEEGRFGGPQKRIAEVAKGLKEEGIETTVIIPHHQSGKFYRILKDCNVKCIRLPLHQLSRKKNSLLKYGFFCLYEVFILFQVLRKGNYKIVHVSGGSWQYKGAIAGKLSGATVLWHLNDTNIPFLLRKMFKFLAPVVAHGFIVAAREVREYYIKQLGFHSWPVYEIQAPVDCTFYNPDTVDPDEKISSMSGPKIVCVSNINPVKGIEYFIAMAEILNRRHTNLHFFIVGPVYDTQVEYFSKLKKLIKERKINNLHFYGECQNVDKVLKATDIYVCSSVSEASPLSVWEAMGMRKAIVSTSVGDVPLFVENSKSGYIVPIRNPEALAEKVDVFLKKPDLRIKLGNKAREIAMKNLDISICIKRHKEAYYSIQSKPGNINS